MPRVTRSACPYRRRYRVASQRVVRNESAPDQRRKFQFEWVISASQPTAETNRKPLIKFRFGPHQFRTRNELNKGQQTRTKTNKIQGKSTNLIDILSLITVWLQVRLLPGPPTKSVGYQQLFRRSGITAPETFRLARLLVYSGGSQTSPRRSIRQQSLLFNRRFGGFIARIGQPRSASFHRPPHISSDWLQYASSN